MTKASTIVAVERFLLVALLAAIAKCKERVILVLAVPNRCPIFAPRGFNARLMLVVLLFLLLTIELPSKASDLHLLVMRRGERSLPRISRPDVPAQLGKSIGVYGPGLCT